MAGETLLQTHRRLRLTLPQPYSTALGRLAHLPQIARGDTSTRVAFAEERLIEGLLAGNGALEGVGAGLSERVIEVPWVLRSLPSEAGARVLDVGTAFAPVVYKRLLMRRPETVVLADLAEVDVPGLASHVADIRALPFERDSFEVATCISTLEHIGMDNAHYEIESGGGGDVAGLRELGRVARRVLVTVPGGRDEELNWLRQYSALTFRERACAAGLAVLRLDVFAHVPERGWCRADPDSIGDRRFGQGGVYAAAALICAELRRADAQAS